MVPLATNDSGDFGVKEVYRALASLRGGETSGDLYLTVADFHAAYLAGKVSPVEVAEAILHLATTSSEHAKAFLDIKRHIVLAAAEESSKRYKAGKPLGILDGVPVGVKDEVVRIFASLITAFVLFQLSEVNS